MSRLFSPYHFWRDHKFQKVSNIGLMINLDLWVAHFTVLRYCSKLNKGSVYTKAQIWIWYENVQLSEVYTRRTNKEAVCLAVLFLNVLPRNTNIMADKGLNFFDQSTAEVHSFSSGESKRCTSGSVTNSQRMLPEIEKSSAIAITRIWEESNTVKHLKAFGKILAKCKFHILS